MTAQDWTSVIDVHLNGTFYVSRAAAEHFRKQESGAFVHMSSQSGLIGNYGQANYSAAKLGITALSKSIALDMKRYNVRSNCIAPNAWSRMTSSIPSSSPAEKARVERLQKMTPDKNAPLAICLLSDAASDVTGQVFVSRNNEIFLMSSPRPIRGIQRSDGWTPELVAEHALPALRASFMPLDRSGEVFSWDPSDAAGCKEPAMSIKNKACIVGAFEHPTRRAPDKSVAQLHAEVARGAIADAGLSKDDIDGYFCGGDAPGVGPLSMVDYLNLRVRHVDSTETGGSSYLMHVAHAAEAIAAGKCNIALVTLAGRPRSEGQATGTGFRPGNPNQPDSPWEASFAPATSTATPCARCGTCTNSAPPASSSPGSRSPPAIMRSTIPMRCCATW